MSSQDGQQGIDDDVDPLFAPTLIYDHTESMAQLEEHEGNDCANVNDQVTEILETPTTPTPNGNTAPPVNITASATTASILMSNSSTIYSQSVTASSNTGADTSEHHPGTASNWSSILSDLLEGSRDPYYQRVFSDASSDEVLSLKEFDPEREAHYKQQVLNDAEKRLFRNRSDYMDDKKEKIRKYQRRTLVEAIQRHNFARGTSDLTGMTSTCSQLGQRTDCKRPLGEIPAKYRKIMDKQYTSEELRQSLQSSSINSDDTEPLEGCLSFTSQFYSSGNSLGSHSSAISDQSPPPFDTRVLTTAIPSQAPSVNVLSPSFASPPVESVELQSSTAATTTTTDYTHVTSTFPERDFEAIQDILHQSHDDDSIPLEQIQEEEEQGYTVVPLRQEAISPPKTSNEMETTLTSTSRQLRSSRSSTSLSESLNNASTVSTRPSSAITPVLPIIMFSSSVADDLRHRRNVTAMGATIVTEWNLCTHLVVDVYRRTLSNLCALASGRWIVSGQWLENSVYMGRFVDETDYVLIRQQQNYFANQKIFFTRNSTIRRQDAQNLVKAAGAKLQLNEPSLSSREIDHDLVIVKSDNAREDINYDDAGYQTLTKSKFLDLYERSDA